mmetsp:Transcript_26624/g.55553  ORF Transcript_26624/g.55553 Transcript_26624/m.55553 type:complete len:474 (-) Transcript_26624:93-1514(-)
MLVLCDELDEPPLVLGKRVLPRVSDLEVDREGGRGVYAAEAPGVRVPLPYGGLRHVPPRLVERRARAYAALDLELLGRHALEGGGEAHSHSPLVALPLGVPPEHPPERLLEDRLPERVPEDHEPPRLLRHDLHLQHPDLVERAREDVDDVLRRRRPLRQPLVVLARALEHRGLVLGEVGVGPHVLGLGPADYGPGAVRARAAREEHGAAARPGHGRLEEAGGGAEGAAGGTRDPHVGGDGPRVLGELLEDGLEGEGALADGAEEATDGGADAGAASLLGGVDAQAEEVLDLLGVVLLVPPEDVRLGALGESQLVHVYVGPVSDEAHQGVLRQQVERLLQRVLKLVELVVVDAYVDDEDEGGGGGLGGRLELVLHGGVLGDELGGEVSLAYVLGVVGREVVSLQAERAGPQLAPEVNLAEGVEDGRATLASAADGIVRQGRRGVRDLLEGSIQGGHGRHYPGGLQPGRWPIVPR